MAKLEIINAPKVILRAFRAVVPVDPTPLPHPSSASPEIAGMAMGMVAAVAGTAANGSSGVMVSRSTSMTDTITAIADGCGVERKPPEAGIGGAGIVSAVMTIDPLRRASSLPLPLFDGGGRHAMG